MRSSSDPASPLGPRGDEVQILGYPRAILAEGVHVQPNPLPPQLEVVVVQVEVEKVDVPRRLDVGRDVGADDLAGDGQGRVLRDVVNVPIARAEKSPIFLL